MYPRFFLIVCHLLCEETNHTGHTGFLYYMYLFFPGSQNSNTCIKEYKNPFFKTANIRMCWHIQ